MDRGDMKLIRVLQDEMIYLEKSPFKKAAELLGWELEEVLERTKRLKEAGVIRRFGAALTPVNAGFRANAMVAWEVERHRAEQVAEVMSGHHRVSHCYIRPTFEGFPYNVYTMIHGNSPEDLNNIISELSSVAEVNSFRPLHSLKEFKKSSPVYFPAK